MAVYPASIISFTTKTNKVDLVDAAHINSLQNEVVAIQTELGKDVAGTQTDLLTRLGVSFATNGAIRNGTVEPGSPVEGQAFWRTDTDVLEIYNGSAWSALGSTSNVIYSWIGRDTGSQSSGGAAGVYVAAVSNTPTDTTAVNLLYMHSINTSGSYIPVVLPWKWKKIAGVNTLTVNARIWSNNGNACTARLDAGGQQATQTFTTSSPAWITAFTLDVSSLTTGTTYDMKLEAQRNSGGAPETFYVSALIIYGS